jgi:anti-anti-sigma factor
MAALLEHSPRNEKAAGEVIVVHFTGSPASLDADTVPGVSDELLALADEPGGPDLLLDFANVDYVSSMALGTLVGLHKKLAAEGRHLTIANLSPRVFEVFAVTRLDGFLDLRRAGEQTGPAADQGRSGSPLGVLVADDDTAVLSVLAAALRRERFHVWLAGHGHQAIELYRRHSPEIAVVLLDVLMPHLDGPHTLTRLRQLSPAVRCCFMTGNPAPYTEEALLQVGAVRVFRKPFAFTEVLSTVNRLAGRPPPCSRDRWIELSPAKECESCWY